MDGKAVRPVATFRCMSLSMTHGASVGSPQKSVGRVSLVAPDAQPGELLWNVALKRWNAM